MIQDLFPPSTRVNRIVPKRTFIDKLGANARMKEYKVVRTYRSPWMSPQNLTVNLHHHTMDGLYESLVRQIAGTLITSDAPKLEEAIE